MSHCYSVGVNIDGKEQHVCTLVPGNEGLSRHVRDMERLGQPSRKPTPEEIDRAIKHHQSQHPVDIPSRRVPLLDH